MVTHRLHTLTDLIRNGYWLQVSCSCGHVAKLDPAILIARLSKVGASTRLDNLSGKLKCSNCGSRVIEPSACNGPEIWSG